MAYNSKLNLGDWQKALQMTGSQYQLPSQAEAPAPAPTAQKQTLANYVEGTPWTGATISGDELVRRGEMRPEVLEQYKRAGEYEARTGDFANKGLDSNANPIGSPKSVEDGWKPGQPLEQNPTNVEPVKTEAERGAENQKQAMDKIGSVLGAIGNFYSGNMMGAVSSAQGLMGGEKKEEDSKGSGPDMNSLMSMWSKFGGG